MLLHTFRNILVKKLFGTDLVGRYAKYLIILPYYYWRQHAAVRWDGEVSREVGVERGVRQGCVISPMLFNLYSEYMIQEAMEGVEGIGFGGVNITNLRYADDAVLVAEKRKKCRDRKS